MEPLDQYRQCIREVIQRHSRYQLAYGEVELQQIFDTEHDHYQLVHVGWHNKRRKYGCLMHMDLKDGKIWIRYDGTERSVVRV